MSVNPFQQTKLSFNADFKTYKRIPNLKVKLSQALKVKSERLAKERKQTMNLK